MIDLQWLQSAVWRRDYRNGFSIFNIATQISVLGITTPSMPSFGKR